MISIDWKDSQKKVLIQSEIDVDDLLEEIPLRAVMERYDHTDMLDEIGDEFIVDYCKRKGLINE